MPKKSAIDIKSLGKQIVEKTQEIVDNVPTARPDAPKEEKPRVVGRPKESIISRKNAKTVYFDDVMLANLEDIKFNNRVNVQRVIQTAIHDFLETYFKDGKLDQKGMDRIANYDKSVSV